MSHELRTPLNGVLGYAQLLQRDQTLEPRPSVRHSKRSRNADPSCWTSLMMSSISLRSKRGGWIFQEAPTDLDDPPHRSPLRRRGSRQAQGTHIDDVDRRQTYRAASSSTAGAFVRCSSTSSATRSSSRPSGEVGLLIARVEDGSLAFEVSDTGIGMEAEALTEISTTFSQTKDGAAAGGTGLGLTIFEPPDQENVGRN